MPHRRPYPLTTAHADCRLSRAPRWFKNTASASPFRAQRCGSSRGRPAAPSHSANAALATRPNGTSRSFDPLPYSRAARCSRSRSPIERPTTSLMRAPVAYRNSSIARSRRDTGSVPTTLSSRLVTSASLSGFGRPAGTRTPSRSPVGSSPRRPSSARNRWNIRMAASWRATLAGAAAERRSPRYRSRSLPTTVAMVRPCAINQPT